MTPALAVNQVNPVDLFVERKMSMNMLLYTLICGALSLLVALRLSEIITTLSQSFFKRFRFGLLWNAFINFIFIILLIAMFAFVMRHLVFNRPSTKPLRTSDSLLRSEQSES